MKSKKFNPTRRKFLQHTGTALAYSQLFPFFKGSIETAHAATRRHLINIVTNGGWNTYWTHNHIPTKWGTFKNNSTQILSGGTVVRTEDLHYTSRYDDSDANAFLHPNRSDIHLGLVMEICFKNRPSHLKDHILIWRGLAEEGLGHGMSNITQMQGGLSQYALSFSSLLAGKQAVTQGAPLPLHFAQIADTPADLFTRWAFAKGPQIPVNIGNYSSFQALTRPNTREFADNRRDFINDAIRNLASIGMGNLKLNSSKLSYRGYQDSFAGAVAIGGSGMSDSIKFLSIWRNYIMSAIDAMKAPYSAPYSTRIAAMAPTYFDISKVNPSSDFNSAIGGVTGGVPTETECKDAIANEISSIANKTALSTSAANVKTRLKAFIARNVGAFSTVRDRAYPFAMAEFLVSENLSTAVDIPAPTGDNHDQDDSHFMNLLFTFACYRRLMDSLVDSGLIEYTTVVMTSDFDRRTWQSTSQDAIRRGTDHHNTVSVLLAGKGIYGGRVVGDVMTSFDDPASPGNPAHQAFTAAVNFSEAMPIDRNTGLVKLDGSKYTQKFLFPTMMRIFDIPIPGNQLTEASYIEAVVNTSKAG